MATIFYFHGFGSTPNSSKVTALKEAFPEHDIIAPHVPLDPTKTVKMIVEQVQALDNFPVMFVGTSLGGFWANHFAQAFDAPCVLVNPSITPSAVMETRIGQELHNYETGELLTPITNDMVDVYKQIETVTNENYNGALVSLFGAKDDDVINVNETVEKLKYFKFTQLFEDGGHRFTERFGAVITHIQSMLGEFENDTEKV